MVAAVSVLFLYSKMVTVRSRSSASLMEIKFYVSRVYNLVSLSFNGEKYREKSGAFSVCFVLKFETEPLK